MILLNSGRLELAFDSSCGALRRITDLGKGLVLAESQKREPFILELEQNCFSSEFQSFSYTEESDGIHFCWTLENEIVIQATAKAREEKIAFTGNVTCKGSEILSSLEYPLIDGIKSISGDSDYAAHSFATGFLVENPTKAFEKDGDGFRYMPYPESFSGSSMQFFTYYAKNQCGLYFAAYDSQFYPKWLNLYKSGDALRASQVFGYEDIGPGKPLEAPWEFTIQATEGDDWYEACDIYREWALKQPWCSKGKLKEIPADQKASWLLEDMGAATFGINGMHDRTKWIRKYSKSTGTPIFHVTGPDWSRVPQTYGSGVPGGYGDWFPTCFSKENIDTWKELGDRFAPFEFDFLIDPNKGDGEKIKPNLQKWPEKPKSCDAYHFNMLCPLCDYTKNLHIERDRRVVAESGADAMYYDISANNILKTCMSPDHGHPVGAGKEMTQAYREIYRETKKALSQDSGKYVPLGTEMINETFLDVLDYYQARANAQPCSALETWPYRKLVQENRAWTIPMFQYVYSGYAPLRLDGWGKIVAEGGDLVYHTIAKTYLWGGLFEINSEYSPMEIIDKEGENSSDEHYCALQPKGFRFDEKIAAYLRKFASLRTGPYGKFLAYGEMLRAPALECRQSKRTYFQYNHGAHSGEQHSRGVISRESVISQAYKLDGEIITFLTNTTDFPQEITLSPTALPLSKTCIVCWNYTAEEQKEEEVDVQSVRKLTLEPFQLVAIHAAETT